jgi:hypothetical protein
MSHHRNLTGEQVIAGRIRDRIVELVEPRTEVISQHVLSDDRTRMEVRDTKTEHPSLIGQLSTSVKSQTDQTSSSGYGSRPTLNVAGVSVLQDITSESWIWLRALDRKRAARADMRDSLTARLYRLHDLAATLPLDLLSKLDVEVTRWWAQARVTTSWGDAPYRPHVPCAECGKIGGLCVTLTPTAAACLDCGAVWDAATIGILGNHVQIMLEPPIDMAPQLGPTLPRSLTEVPSALAEVPDNLRGLIA